MADVKWIKICTDIFDDEKILLIETMPDAYAIITVWFKLLCLAGKTNNSGVFMMNQRIAYTDKMLATIFRMKESIVQLALNTFYEFGMIEIIDGIITIPNWGKHQSLDQLEKKTEYMKNYMQEYRSKQKQICKTNSKVNSKTNSKANVSCTEEEKIREDKIEEKSNKENSHTIFARLVEEGNYQFSTQIIIKLEEWIKYKSERKESYKEQGMKSFLTQVENKVNEYGEKAVCDLIDECMASGWKGIIYDRLQKKSGIPNQGRLAWIDDI